MSDAVEKPMDDGDVPQGGTKRFQISEPDLAELERMLPELLEFVTHAPGCQPRHRVMFRNVQTIIVNMRWNYGPHTEVGRIEA